MNIEQEYNKTVAQMGVAWERNEINAFLTVHQRLVQLFTIKLQEEINKKEGKTVSEINFNVDENIMKEIKTFNENVSKLHPMKEGIKDESIPRENKQNSQ